MICSFGFVTYLIGTLSGCFLMFTLRINTIYIGLNKSIIVWKIVWRYSGIVIPWFRWEFFLTHSSFSYYNFRIPSIKCLANCKIPLPFRCNPLLLRWLLFMFPFSIMSICNIWRLDWICPIFTTRCFEPDDWMRYNYMCCW